MSDWVTRTSLAASTVLRNALASRAFPPSTALGEVSKARVDTPENSLRVESSSRSGV